MRFDLHTHTNRYSACGKATPQEMMAGAIDHSLDGIVITEHNVLWSEEEINELRAAFPKLVILRGIEVTTAHGEHVLVFGITDPSLFTEHMEDSVLGEIIAEHQGAAMLAHPFRYHDEIHPDTMAMPLHAIEIASSNIRKHMQGPIDALVKSLGIPAAASSDAHWPENLGLYGMEFPYRINTEQELAAAIRKGDFTIFADTARVNQMNLELGKEISLASRLMDQGYSDRQIRDLYGSSMSMLQALRAGKEVELVTPIP
ncbi:MAG: PHP domain-containing protein [Firmicutes bacterium]|nr:PHP domain-containing protein [Bacillota bacterium]